MVSVSSERGGNIVCCHSTPQGVQVLYCQGVSIESPVLWKGFGCRPVTDGTADTEAWSRRPKASKEGNRGKWQAVVPRALGGFACGGRGA